MASKIIEAGGPLLQRYSKIASYHVDWFLILITTWVALWQATMMEVDTAGAQSGAQPPLRRVDGRGNDQLRPPGIELGPNNRADGSARVSHVSPSNGSLKCFYDLEQKSLRYRDCRRSQGNTADGGSLLRFHDAHSKGTLPRDLKPERHQLGETYSLVSNSAHVCAVSLCRVKHRYSLQFTVLGPLVSAAKRRLRVLY